jgi:hypothetical protein
MRHLHLPFADDMKLLPKPQPEISRKWHLYVMLMLVSQKMRGIFMQAVCFMFQNQLWLPSHTCLPKMLSTAP